MERVVRELLESLDEYWRVVELARSFRALRPADEFYVLASAVSLHDVGYAPELPGPASIRSLEPAGIPVALAVVPRHRPDGRGRVGGLPALHRHAFGDGPRQHADHQLRGGAVGMGDYADLTHTDTVNVFSRCYKKGGNKPHPDNEQETINVSQNG